MQHVDDASELDRVNGPACFPIIVLDHFENPGPFEVKPFKGLASGCLAPVCASKRACPTVRRTPLGNIFRSFLLDATQKTGFGPWSSGSSLFTISIMPYLACLRNYGFSRRIASGNGLPIGDIAIHGGWLENLGQMEISPHYLFNCGQ